MKSNHQFPEVEPDGLEWTSASDITISWNDGSRFTYRRAFLREHCPCATCRGTHGSTATLVKEVAPPLLPPPGKKASFAIMAGPKPPSRDVATTLTSADPVGAYAMRLSWGDGHTSGIYSWRYLRFLGEVMEGRATLGELE